MCAERTRDPECTARGDCPAFACSHLRTPPYEGVRRRHETKLALCDILERIADSLPGPVDWRLCRTVAAQLIPQIRDAQQYEEESIFPAFVTDETRSASVHRLRCEHVQDEALAEELTEMLLAIGHGARIENPEALGYMLRAFFEPVRRHIAFEREHVVALLKQPQC